MTEGKECRGCVTREERVVFGRSKAGSLSSSAVAVVVYLGAQEPERQVFACVFVDVLEEPVEVLREASSNPFLSRRKLEATNVETYGAGAIEMCTMRARTKREVPV